jgi:hypothetical protein
MKRVQLKTAKSSKNKTGDKKSRTSKSTKKKSVIVKIEMIDKLLLKLGKNPYANLISTIEKGTREGKKRLNAERRLALKLGQRILLKAKKVRDSLMESAKSSRK